MALERTYNVPLRREWLKVPKYKRAKKAVTALRQFLVKHMKSEDVSIGRHANLEIWKHGMRNPPHHIKVNVTKSDEGKVVAELVGAPVEKPKEEKKGKQTRAQQKAAIEKALAEAKAKKAAEKEAPAKTEEKPVEKKAEPKKEEAVEKKAEAKEEPKAESKVAQEAPAK